MSTTQVFAGRVGAVTRSASFELKMASTYRSRPIALITDSESLSADEWRDQDESDAAGVTQLF